MSIRSSSASVILKTRAPRSSNSPPNVSAGRRIHCRQARGRGFAFARYKNSAAYLALAVEAEVEPETGRVVVTRAVAAIDSGEIVNPDGIRNQTEGGILQSI